MGKGSQFDLNGRFHQRNLEEICNKLIIFSSMFTPTGLGMWIRISMSLGWLLLGQYSTRFSSLTEYFRTEQPNNYGKGSPAPATDNRGVDSRLGDTYLFELLASNASLNCCHGKK
jgi:hypothetical protein